MSVDTYGIINKNIKFEDILSIVKNKYDKNAQIEISNNDKGLAIIHFKDGVDERTLTLIKDKNSKYNEYEFLTEDDYMWLKLGFWGNSVDIMKIILTQFENSWIDENDCDNESWYRIIDDIQI